MQIALSAAIAIRETEDTQRERRWIRLTPAEQAEIKSYKSALINPNTDNTLDK